MYDDAELQPTLQEAQETLKHSLSEACGTDPSRADTGELIRLEEMLSIASDAAKKAVSVRRRLGEKRRKSAAKAPREPLPERTTPTEGHDAVSHPALVQRTFTDARGVAWSVWSVYPSQGAANAALRGTFSQGWLAFECDVERRRLSPIPDDWEQLDEAGLASLCGQAVTAAPPRRRSSRPSGEGPAPDAPPS